jgi:hypothetical protein
MHDLVISDTEIHTFSGDAVQLDPVREPPGWDQVRIQGCTFWLAPLEEDQNGYTAGTVPGENAIDTKTYADSPRSRMTVVDTVAFGFRDGLVFMSAFNIKNQVEVTFDRVTVYDSQVAFRLRGPGTYGGAHAIVMNAVIYDVDTAVRYEDDIERMEIFNCTFGAGIATFFNEEQADNAGMDVRNLLLLADTLPPEAAHSSNLVAGEDAFVDSARHDYHLVAGSPAVDQGTFIAPVTTDRDGIPRPQGEAFDTGAYEWTDAPPDAGMDAGFDAGNDADSGPPDAADTPEPGDPDDAGDADEDQVAGGADCGCQGHPAGGWLLGLALPLALALRRRPTWRLSS